MKKNKKIFGKEPVGLDTQCWAPFENSPATQEVYY